MKRVSSLVGAVCVVTSLFVLVGIVPVYADANPDNRGHHYGQLKHHKQPPASNPAPNPVPASVPVPSTSPGPVVHTNPALGKITAGNSQPSPLPIATPAPVNALPAVTNKAAAVSPISGDPLWWLVIAILPLILAVWLIAFRGVVLQGIRFLRPQPHAQPVPAPARA